MMAQVTDLQLVMRMMGGPSDCQTITYTMDFPTTQHYSGPFANMTPYFQRLHVKVSYGKLNYKWLQAFHYFGWLTVAPMLASHLLTCAVAVWMAGS